MDIVQFDSTRLPYLQTIIEKLHESDFQWFEDKHILVGRKSDYFILNYIQSSEAHKHKEYTSLTRGLIVKQNIDIKSPFSNIVSFPMTRFFNQGEPSADAINLENSEMIEKKDGTMVAVFHDNEERLFQTRKMISNDINDKSLLVKSFKGTPFILMDVIKNYVEPLNLKNYKDHTLVFEFIHEASAILTEYKPSEYGLYLLSARNLNDFSEYNETKLDSIAEEIGAKRPQRFILENDKEYISTKMKEMKDRIPNFEGWIFRDKDTGIRIKVKDIEYVEKHALVGQQTYKNLLPIYFKEEQNEVISYLPNTKEAFNTIDKTIKQIISEQTPILLSWNRKNLTKKDKAIQLRKKKYNAFTKDLIFRTHDIELDKDSTKDLIYNQLKTLALGTEKTKPKLNTLVDLINDMNPEHIAL